MIESGWIWEDFSSTANRATLDEGTIEIRLIPRHALALRHCKSIKVLDEQKEIWLPQGRSLLSEGTLVRPKSLVTSFTPPPRPGY